MKIYALVIFVLLSYSCGSTQLEDDLQSASNQISKLEKSLSEANEKIDDLISKNQELSAAKERSSSYYQECILEFDKYKIDLLDKKYGALSIFGNEIYLENGPDKSIETCKGIINELIDRIEDYPDCKAYAVQYFNYRYRPR